MTTTTPPDTRSRPQRRPQRASSSIHRSPRRWRKTSSSCARAENARILTVFGAGALDVSPRIGHLHITVDDAPWHWVDASGEPLMAREASPGAPPVGPVLKRSTCRV